MPNAPEPLPTDLLIDALRQVYYFDRQKAVDIEKEVTTYLQEHDHQYPNRELTLLNIYYRHIVDLKFATEIPFSIRHIPIRNAMRNSKIMMRNMFVHSKR